MEVYKNAMNYIKAEELFHVVPGRDVLASIPKDESLVVPTQQELQAVLEDFHRIGLHLAKLKEADLSSVLAVAMSHHMRLGEDSRLGHLDTDLLDDMVWLAGLHRPA